MFARSAKFVLLSCFVCSPLAFEIGSARGTEPLAKRIEELIDGPPFKQAHWGILASDLKTGDVLYARSPDKLFAPASVTKLFSVGAALDALGADYRFETPVYARGEIDAHGRLAGDLILVASGDLSLGGRTGDDGRIAFSNSDHIYADFDGHCELTKPDPLAGLKELARQVAEAGVRQVTGEVLIDDRLFDQASGTGSGPSRLTPIMVNDNLLDFLVTPSAVGEPAQVEWRPKTHSYRVDARAETIAADGKTRIRVSPAGAGRVVVRGQIAAGHAPLVGTYEVDDPASFARALLIEALRRADVAVDASPLTANRPALLPAKEAYAGMKRVALLTSPPFSESAKLVLKVSHNLHASTLPLLLAAKHGQRTLTEGLQLEREFLAKAGLDVDTISFGGAAGGDPADYVTPRATVQLLRYMSTRPDFAVYRQGLPILGQDGTLARAAGPDCPARGKVQAKTGTLLWSNRMNGGHLLTSKALAGYLTTAKGREVAFALFVNHVHAKSAAEREQVGKSLGKLCEMLYQAE
ncbi:MAG TPA: D-alanyl-D-alanine carboxypeptidase/D-alanyl-D-alanine-endopeptidase [Pirellulales bacterium]|nr:D-alanyl-D-alanine carboxypeptidase/D-alanyl-D-alanine-endopeptidase [Pirellulales bacterium]